jgi:hypothetical protein
MAVAHRSLQGVVVTKRRHVWSKHFHFAATALPYEDADRLR